MIEEEEINKQELQVGFKKKKKTGKEKKRQKGKQKKEKCYRQFLLKPSVNC